MLCAGLLCAGLLLPTPAHAQAQYVPGTVVLLPNETADAAPPETLRGQILDQEWVETPSSITFRPANEEAETTYGIDDLAAFTVGPRRYVRKTVSVDQRPTQIQSNYDRPQENFRTQTVFLLVLAEGPMTLYAYQDSRLHLYVRPPSDELEELIYYKEEVTNAQGTFQSTVRRYRDQLAAHRTDACRNRSTKRLSYTAKQIGRFVNACNGAPASDLEPDVEMRSSFRATHVLGGSFGIGSATHETSQQTYTANGWSAGVNYRLLLSRNRSFNPVAGLVGVEVLLLNAASDERRPSPLRNTDRYYSIDETTTRALLVGAELGGRLRMRIGSTRPYLDAAGVVRYALSYDASVFSRGYQVTDGVVEETYARSRPTAPSPWDAVQLGIRGGTGVELGTWSVGVVVEQGFRSNDQFGTTAPPTFRATLTAARQF